MRRRRRQYGDWWRREDWLGFRPTARRRFRAIDVRVKRNDLTVFSRKEYVVHPPAPLPPPTPSAR